MEKEKKRIQNIKEKKRKDSGKKRKRGKEIKLSLSSSTIETSPSCVTHLVTVPSFNYDIIILLRTTTATSSLDITKSSLTSSSTIVLNIGRDEQYIPWYIILDGLPIRFKSPILAHILDISSDILLPMWKLSIQYDSIIWYLEPCLQQHNCLRIYHSSTHPSSLAILSETPIIAFIVVVRIIIIPRTVVDRMETCWLPL